MPDNADMLEKVRWHVVVCPVENNRALSGGRGGHSAVVPVELAFNMGGHDSHAKGNVTNILLELGAARAT